MTDARQAHDPRDTGGTDGAGNSKIDSTEGDASKGIHTDIVVLGAVFG